nr:hypothetical protein [Tanacetum cinerariifolium]
MRQGGFFDDGGSGVWWVNQIGLWLYVNDWLDLLTVALVISWQLLFLQLTSADDTIACKLWQMCPPFLIVYLSEPHSGRQENVGISLGGDDGNLCIDKGLGPCHVLQSLVDGMGDFVVCNYVLFGGVERPGSSFSEPRKRLLDSTFVTRTVESTVDHAFVPPIFETSDYAILPMQVGFIKSTSLSKPYEHVQLHAQNNEHVATIEPTVSNKVLENSSVNRLQDLLLKDQSDIYSVYIQTPVNMQMMIHRRFCHNHCLADDYPWPVKPTDASATSKTTSNATFDARVTATADYGVWVKS